MKRFISDKRFAYILGVILLVILWQAFSLMVGEQTMVFPGPVSTFEYALYLLGKPYTYRAIGQTLLRMFSGFGISFVFALLIGTVAGNSLFIEELLKPFMTTIRAIPTVSLIYLFIVLYGFKNAPMALVIMICFPIIYEGVKDGIKNVDEDIIKASRVDGASLFKENIMVRLPLAVPYIVVALTSSFSLSFKIEIMAEVITGSTNLGLGSAILGARSADPTNMVPIFAYSLIAIVLILIIDCISNLIKNIFKV